MANQTITVTDATARQLRAATAADTPVDGSGNTLLAGTSPALASPTATTQAAADNSTKVATTAYVDRTVGSTVASPADPAGTTATAAAVMMGLAGTVTPTKTGRVLFTVSGQLANGTAGDGATVQMQTGTGTAPLNGAALTGTQRGNIQTVTSVSAAQKSGFGFAVPVTGLTLGTAVWIDIAVKAVTGGTATATGLTVSAVEF